MAPAEAWQANRRKRCNKVLIDACAFRLPISHRQAKIYLAGWLKSKNMGAILKATYFTISLLSHTLFH